MKRKFIFWLARMMRVPVFDECPMRDHLIQCGMFPGEFLHNDPPLYSRPASIEPLDALLADSDDRQIRILPDGSIEEIKA
jgi:hypothetical protein